MAKNTDIKLRDAVIYSIYVRNHTKEGTFRAIEPDLDRIKELGTDIIWFMPIHPIGIEGKKGTLGCPYANKDYRTVNPEYGTMEDFKCLVDLIHEKDMKCIIDVVYNHTSPDSVLTKEHPEFFHRKENGEMGNRVGDWSDVVDLDYNNKDLWEYQVESLKFWASIVDGFRCDVASLVPLDFWCYAREEVSKVNPDCIWLAETIEYGFIKYCRSLGYKVASDCEMYTAFDMEYDYDIWNTFKDYLEKKSPLSRYVERLNMQEAIYPDNYIKMHCLENHDQPRIKSYIKDPVMLKNWTAFLYFQKGATLLYAGQEFENKYQPSLFEKDDISIQTGHDLSGFMRRLYNIKKQILPIDSDFEAVCDDENGVVVATRVSGHHKIVGVFTLEAKETMVDVPLNDGEYINLVTREKIMVEGGKLTIKDMPMILV